MRYYETMYIVHPALEAGRLKDLIDFVNGTLKDKGNEVLYNELWGKKKLSYFIDKQRYGTYILVQYKGDGINNNEFNMELEHNANILAYLTTSIEESNVLQDHGDINVQIDGDGTADQGMKDDSSTVEKDGEENNSKADSSSSNDKINVSDEVKSVKSEDKEEKDENKNLEEATKKTEDTEDEKEKVEE